jgi:hypothetical protein
LVRKDLDARRPDADGYFLLQLSRDVEKELEAAGENMKQLKISEKTQEWEQKVFLTADNASSLTIQGMYTLL